ncbi:ThuA domain-containing protein [Sphingomonas sp. AP4-R1]|uniref:ThuA domain-containing protein n=1 Tax=Sphingomonas sp. AP4-R1 TaxID=2735134 RepID=UPI0014933A2D|nr:ThuA domain-containing protein [Sphingomonas sp. AP4-R1]QJU59281.1 ThuA domain-containing protein [Sphingomonas sp. AP4-R1]
MRPLTIFAWAAVAAFPAIAQTPPAPPPSGGTPPPGMGDPWVGRKKLLVIADVQTGFQHDSINHAMGVIEQLGRESGAYISVLRTDSQLITDLPIKGQGTRYSGRPINAHSLSYFDAVFFLGSGVGSLTDQQKADLLNFVKQGKGFIAGHAATVAYYEWPAFTDLIGGFMDSEYRVETMKLLNDDPKFPGASAFPKAFTLRDQFPVMKAPFSSKDVHVILRLDPRALTPDQLSRRPDGDIPLMWAKPYGQGRVVNLTIGHQEEVWDDPRFRKLALGAIRWALGGVPADVALANSSAPAK